MTSPADLTAAEQITALVDILRTAVAEVTVRLGRSYEAGAVALKWMEGEIAPLLDVIVAKHSQAVWITCPRCGSGETRFLAGLVITHSSSTEGVLFSCGHRVRMVEALPDGTQRMMFSLSSEVPVQDVVEITIRPPVVAFAIEQLVIQTNPDHWQIDMIRLGNISQIREPIAGYQFARELVPLPIQWGRLQTGMDIHVTVRYVGPVEGGEVFMGLVIGLVPRDPTDEERVQDQQTAMRARADQLLTPAQVRNLTAAWEGIMGVPAADAQQLARDLAAMTPRERADYRARELLANRPRVDDGQGGCMICAASFGMWCDHVAHAQAGANIRVDGEERTSMTTVTEVEDHE